MWLRETGGQAAMLSESEQRQLDDIEHQLALDDPRFVLAMRGARHIGKLTAALFALFVAWTVATTASVVLGWWLAAAILGGAGVASLITLAVCHIVAWTRCRRPNQSNRSA
jgi:Protein of unknown function (DUF3040)